jgi:hypothetical protein
VSGPAGLKGEYPCSKNAHPQRKCQRRRENGVYKLIIFQTTPSTPSRKSIIVRLVCAIVRNRNTLVALVEYAPGLRTISQVPHGAARSSRTRHGIRHSRRAPTMHANGAPIKKGAANGTFFTTTSFC